jgi:hypothetical protein
MTKISGKRDHRPALVAALTLLGASLGVSTPAGAASDTTGLFLKGHDTTTSKQHKGEIELQSFTIKHQTPTTGTQIKGETTSNQYKEHPASNQHKVEAPSAMFLKHNVAPVSNQHKVDVHSNQIKLDTPNKSR